MSRGSERVRKRKRRAFKMDLLVVSDTHGKYNKISEVIELQTAIPKKDRSTYLLHLGDGVSDLDRAKIPEDMCVFSVRGNCDVFYAEGIPNERVFTLFGKKIVALHGHGLSVKQGDVLAIEYAIKNEADILLYGHTHKRTEYVVRSGESVGRELVKKDLLVFNPGSLGYDNSFGIITINENGILASHGMIK